MKAAKLAEEKHQEQLEKEEEETKGESVIKSRR